MAVVHDKDMGYRRFLRTMRNLSKGDPHVVVGILQDKGSQEYKDGPTLVEVATYNEFGTRDGHVPERSFLRSTADKKRERYASEMSSGVGRVIDGKSTIKHELGRVGIRAVRDVQQTIRAIDSPKNAPATIRRKRSSNPLLDTRRMSRSIAHDVRGV